MENLNTINSIKYFVVSDIHSFYEPMMTALTEKGFDITNPNHRIIICGDLFDRGPDTIKCLDFAKQMAKEGRLEYIMGNHESLLFECLELISKGFDIPSHHFTNGTLSTISQITGYNVFDILHQIFDRKEFGERIDPLVSFISDNCVEYVEIGDYVFVHGWVPTIIEKSNSSFYSTKRPDPNWRDGNWSAASWLNGMEMWKYGAKVPDKTVVCGHWHTSWGWSHLRQKYKEWEPKEKTCFLPFIDDGIIAIDACTAYTGKVNCVVFEVVDDKLSFLVDN